MKITEARNDPRSFWDKRAKTFPRYSAGESCYEAGMLNLAREHGISFRHKRVLDIGSGSGMYTIRLALEAEWVTALDISGEMLGVLRADAEALGLFNIDYVRADWLSFQTDEKFDLIFCSMTPALSDDEGREKILTLKAGRVVYIGWLDSPHSDVMAGLYERYGVAPPVYNHAGQMHAWLQGKSMDYDSSPVSGRWRVSFDKSDLTCACRNTLNNYGADPDPDFLDQYLGPVNAKD